MPPNEHAEYSPSASDRWLSCPSSILLTKEMEAAGRLPDQESEYAAEGTKAHELAELSLAAGVVGPCEDEEMRAAVQQYVEYVQSVVTPSRMSELYVEHKVTVTDECYGTVDCAWMDVEHSVLHIFDFKYGKHVPVTAEENSQLRIYALGFILSTPELPKPTVVRLHVVQPRAESGITSAEYLPEELRDFGRYVMGRMALSGDHEHYRPSDRACKFCPVKTMCGAYQERLRIREIDYTTPVEVLSDERLVELYRHKGAVEKYYKELDAYLLSRLLQGDDVPGLRLGMKRTVRRFTPEGEAKLEELFGEAAFVTTRKPLTFKELEKLGASKELIRDLTFKPQGGPSVKMGKAGD